MSDVIWAALIAVGGSAITGCIAFLGAKMQAGVATATSADHAKVELAKVEAENYRLRGQSAAETERLREQLREPERQNRQGTYHRLLANLDRFDMWATGYGGDVEDEEFAATLAEFNYLVGAVHLFGAQQVREAMGGLTREMTAIGAEMAFIGRQIREGERPGPQRRARTFALAYSERRPRVIEATAHLTEAMRSDVTEGHLSPGG